MLSRLIGGLRLVLLAPLYICLVAIDEKARWIAVFLYLGSCLAGLGERRLDPSRRALRRINDGLLLVVMSLGMLVGAVITVGSAAACILLIGRLLARLELARADPERFALGDPGPADVGIALLTGLSFVLLLAPGSPGLPPDVDIHRLGGFMLMACGALALVSLAAETVRKGRSGVIAPE